MTSEADLAAAAQHLRAARSALFITGAGISADSGLPTYRGVGGLYAANQPPDAIPIERLLSGPMFLQHPEGTWKYLFEVERACRTTRPNRAHEVIARLESRLERVWVLTQNVDGLHRQAGSKNVIEIHGHIYDMTCTACAYAETVQDFSGLSMPPVCPQCGALLRPGVVLFGEVLPQDKLAALQAQQALGFDVVFSIGTSSLFPYVVEPVVQARERGIPTVEINPAQTGVSNLVDLKLPMRAAEACEAIFARLASG
jgi:NAD-dependent deacetylase